MTERVLKDLPDDIGGPSVDVIEADSLTQEIFINDYVRTNTPCLIKNAIKHWPAIEKWKEKQYLVNAAGNYELDVYSIRNYLNNKKMKDNGKQLTFSEGLELALQEDDTVVSMPANTIDKDGQFSELLQDVGGFSFLESQPDPYIYDRNRFFAYKSAGTAWHQHPLDESLMCQVVGSKRVALLCSTNADYPLFEKAFRVDDHGKYSALLEKNAQYLSLVTVEEGDSLYIPPYWYHGIDPVDEKFGITFAHCWKSSLHKFGEMKYPKNRANLVGIFTCLPYIPNYFAFLLFSLCARGLFLEKMNKLKKFFRKATPESDMARED